MSRLLNYENLANMLAKSRIDAGFTQKKMAQHLGKSPSTIKNYENGSAVPNLIDMIEWFEVLGLSPMRYVLDFLYPDIYNGITEQSDDKSIEKAINHYIDNVAPTSEKRKIAYCVFGNSGSSWSAQVDLLTTINHLPLISRIAPAQNALDVYEIEQIRGNLIGEGRAMPDIENLRHAINEAKKSVSQNKTGYTNQN